MDSEQKKFFTYEDLRTPPMGIEARRQAGFLLRSLQEGEVLSMPISRPMPSIGNRCHELRIIDSETNTSWRIVYYFDAEFVVVLDCFKKKSQATPKKAIERSKDRLKQWMNS